MGGPAIVDGKKIKEFDNFYRCKFIENGINYFSSEQYYQSKKNDSKEFLDKILNCKTSGEAWSIGNECELRKNWEEIKIDVMRTGNYLKFSQNQSLTNLLIKSCPYQIHFKRSTDFWNEANSEILMDLRSRFRLSIL